MDKVFKTCFKCKLSKNITEFYHHQYMADGHLNKCKSCTRIDQRQARRNRINYYRAYDKKRGSRLPRSHCPTWRANNPEKYRAHTMVNNAVRDKRLIKESCFFCGNQKSHAHHPDYSKPLSVIWLCAGCHQLIHAYEDKIKELINQ